MNTLKKTLAGVAAAGTAIAGAVVASGGQETKPAQQEPQTMPEMFAQLQRDDERRCTPRRIQLDDCRTLVIAEDCSRKVVNSCEPEDPPPPPPPDSDD